MSTTPWSERPPEQARLLNPAFLGTTVWSCAKGYASIDKHGLPYALSFMVVPIVLHKATRECLPRTPRTSMASWLGDNPRAQVGFAERARALLLGHRGQVDDLGWVRCPPASDRVVQGERRVIESPIRGRGGDWRTTHGNAP